MFSAIGYVFPAPCVVPRVTAFRCLGSRPCVSLFQVGKLWPILVFIFPYCAAIIFRSCGWYDIMIVVDVWVSWFWLVWWRGTRPDPFAREVAQATNSVFERASISVRRGEARLSENAGWLLFCVRRALAWARAFRLSETLQPERGARRGIVLLGCFVVLGWLVFVWVWLLWWEIYNELLCMRDMIHEWWMMDMVGTWHVN